MIARDDIVKVIKKNLTRALDNVSEEQIELEKSMVEYGASSLDIVEVVSSSMRELKVKIPRTELNNIKNLQGLVEIFYKYANPEKVANV